MQTFLTRISYPLRISNCTQQRLQLCTRLGQIRQLQRQQYRNFQQLAILSQKQQQQQQQYADMSTIRPAARVATQKKDVWSTINEGIFVLLFLYLQSESLLKSFPGLSL